jgi:hypothetical protein
LFQWVHSYDPNLDEAARNRYYPPGLTKGVQRMNNTLVSDGCPEWAQVMIDQLLQVEIFLGNIPKVLEWSSERVDAIQRKVYADEKGAITEEVAELLFGRIVKGLTMEGFSEERIIQFVNARIGYKGGPKYCGPDDIVGLV